MKKLFLKDYSPTLDDPLNSPQLTSSPVQSGRFQEETVEYASGIASNISNSFQHENTQSELVKPLREISNLKNDIKAKDSVIKKLNSKMNSLEDTNKNFKKEISSKNEQLKQKNKTIDNLNIKTDDILKKNEVLTENLSKKLDNANKKNGSL